MANRINTKIISLLCCRVLGAIRHRLRSTHGAVRLKQREEPCEGIQQARVGESSRGEGQGAKRSWRALHT